VSVVGALPEGLDAAIEQAFGGWKKPEAPRFVRFVAKPVVIPPARFDVQAKDKTSAMLQMSQRFELSSQDADYLPMLLAVHVLGGGGMESRLSSRVRQQEGLSYGVGAGLQADHFSRDGSLRIGGTFAPQNRERMLAVIQEELARLTRDGISEAELARAKKDLLEGWRQGRANDGGLAGSLNWFAEIGRDWLSQDGALETRLQAVTVVQVHAAWNKLVRPEGFVISTAGDFEKKH
jgi:zinc protease